MTPDRDRQPLPRLAATASAAVPTGWTIFLRTFIPWQMVRFVVINAKMFRLIWRSH